MLLKKNINFDDCFLGYEDYYQFYNDENNKLKVSNPKFSINVDLNKYMPNTSQSNDLPTNLYFAVIMLKVLWVVLVWKHHVKQD